MSRLRASSHPTASKRASLSSGFHSSPRDGHLEAMEGTGDNRDNTTLRPSELQPVRLAQCGTNPRGKRRKQTNTSMNGPVDRSREGEREGEREGGRERERGTKNGPPKLPCLHPQKPSIGKVAPLSRLAHLRLPALRCRLHRAVIAPGRGLVQRLKAELRHP